MVITETWGPTDALSRRTGEPTEPSVRRPPVPHAHGAGSTRPGDSGGDGVPLGEPVLPGRHPQTSAGAAPTVRPRRRAGPDAASVGRTWLPGAVPSLRGTGGSSGVFDGFTINPADGDGVLSWLREQPWFGGVLATWGASYLGFAQWGSPPAISRNGRSRSSSTRRQSLHQFMYPGGGFALGNALGWVQIVDRMFRAGGGTARQFLSLLTAPRSMRRAVATLPVAEADIALTGHRVRWFQVDPSRPGRPPLAGH